jgi:maltose/moltooligosaccharide transporter
MKVGRGMRDRQGSSSEPPSAGTEALADTTLYHVGTLSYTLWGLINVFFWLLLGDFTLTIMESVVPTILPLTLKDLNASNRVIGLQVGGVASIMNMIITPVVSYRSDRHRGSMGRRIPYLLWPTPFVAIFLIVVGFSNDIGTWVHGAIVSRIATASLTTVILVTIGVATIMFQYFNMFVASIYYYLFNDVVPEQFMGRFYGLFRFVGAGAGFIYNYWIFGFADDPFYRKWIYVAVGIVYLVTFMLMCWKVREGDYPPPDVPKGAGVRIAVTTYIRECYSLPYYWWYFIGTALYVVANSCILTFRVFFAKELGLTLDELGKILAWGMGAGMVLYLPLGWVADKIHALRLNVIAVAIMFLIVFASIWAIHDRYTFWIFTFLWCIGDTVYRASNAPMDPLILPKAQFGQFASASAIPRAFAIMAASYAGGWFIDVLGKHVPDHQYRAIYHWASFFTAISFLFMLLVYRQWNQYGGMRCYVAPMVSPIAAPLTSPVLDAIALPAQSARASEASQRIV